MKMDYNLQQKVLHSPFDIAVHKATFVNYLEVVIDAEGVVHYAVPSHQEFIINYIVQTKYGTREALNDAVPREYWFDAISLIRLKKKAAEKYGSSLNCDLTKATEMARELGEAYDRGFMDGVKKERVRLLNMLENDLEDLEE